MRDYRNCSAGELLEGLALKIGRSVYLPLCADAKGRHEYECGIEPLPGAAC